MIIQTNVIDAYINEAKKPEDDSWFYAYTNGTGSMLKHRQEVCKALLDECKQYHEFPVWNQALLLQVLPNISEYIKDLVLLPIVGTNETFDAKIIRHEHTTYVLVDLLHIADYTDRVKQMTYILHNLLHQLILRFYFEQRNHRHKDYIKELEDRFLYEGFILYASWNEDHTQYVFQNSSYETKKETAFGLLYQALHVEDPQTQAMIITTIRKADLWDRFPDVAGMFYFDDLFHAGGVEAFIKTLQHPQGIFHTVFGE